MGQQDMFFPFGNQYETLNDNDLIASIKSGDEYALNYLIDKYKELVNMKVSRYYMIGAEKEDIVQEGMIGLFKAVKNFDVRKTKFF